MKVFDDLIDELREENLIEQSEVKADESTAQPDENDVKKAASAASAASEKSIPETDALVNLDAEPRAPENHENETPPIDENDFFRRRAMEEVSSLKMVEHVLSGVEREQVKVIPQTFDDIAVSKALHEFLQISKNSQGTESAAAEFTLMQETEGWHSSLARRDADILAVHLRRYCETTRPVLSAQALVALARFYRNSTYSETVRSKFDLVATRLFSKETGGERRESVFNYDELVEHLSELYADWSSVPLYADEDDSQLTIIALKFEDFITEAVNASEFEELVKTDFFNRLRAFKESTGENFYAPSVTATAIVCNIRVGNRYVELLADERRKNNHARLEDKYNVLLDQIVSEATSKSLQLVQLLKEKKLEFQEPVEAIKTKSAREKPQVKKENQTVAKKKTDSPKAGIFKINKWLLGLAVIVVAATFALYYWVEFVTPKASSKEVVALELDGYYFKEYLKIAKITNDTLIGVSNASWNGLSDEKKQEILNNLLSVGKEKGYKSVRIIGSEGTTVGYISAGSITQSNSAQN